MRMNMIRNGCIAAAAAADGTGHARLLVLYFSVPLIIFPFAVPPPSSRIGITMIMSGY